MPKLSQIVNIYIFLLWIDIHNVWGQFNCQFTHYSTIDGLSHNGIITSIKDKEGFIWFGTMDGINRFDGINFVTYKSRPGDSVSLSSNRIEEMMEDKWGFIWIRTYDSKVYRFDKKKEKFTAIVTDANVNDILQTTSGDFWLMTQDNLVLRVITDVKDYTIRKLVYFNSSNEIQNPNPFMFEDKLHRIWVNTCNGLYCYDTRFESVTNAVLFSQQEYPGIKDIHLQCYDMASDNNVYFGSTEGKLLKINVLNLQFESIYFNNKFHVQCINALTDSTIYIGTLGNGLFLYNSLNNKIINHNTNELLHNIYALYIDSRHLIWAEIEEEGVVKLDGDINSYRYFKQQSDISPTLTTRNLCSFFEDKNNTLWIGMKKTGFGYYNPQTDQIEYFYNKPGDPNRKMSNYLVSFLYDSTGVMWLSTYNKGIEKITFLENRFRFTQLDKNSINQIANEVRSIYQDSKKQIWVGTKEGKLYLLDTNFNQIKKIDNDIQNGLVYGITEDQEGNIWLATKGKGLYKLEKDSGTGNYHYTLFCHHNDDSNSLSSNYVYSVICDDKGRIWAGTFGGGLNVLTKNSSGSYSIFNMNNSFAHYPKNQALKIRQVFQDRDRNFWLATTDGLIFFNQNNHVDYNQIKFRHFTKIPGNANSLGNNDVLCIYQDKPGTLWFGTMGGGLHQLIDQVKPNIEPRFTIFSKADGLPSDVILSMVADDDNNLWLSTENGISNFNPRLRTFRNFDEYEGLNARYFSEAAMYRKSDGEILCGTFDGIYSFYPSLILNKTNYTNLVFTGFTIFSNTKNKSDNTKIIYTSINNEDTISLAYYQNMFVIDYAGLDYKTQHKLQYAYMLKGIDENWHYVNNEHRATYTNIPPGEYVFNVKLVNPDLQNNHLPVTLHINIQPPPWKSLAAIICYIILGIIIMVLIWRMIVTMIKLRNSVVVEKELTNLKLRFFTNISHELRTPLTLILGPIADIAETENLSDKGREHLQILEKNARRMLRLINQILDFRKIQNQQMKLHVSKVDLCSFVRNITDNFKDIARQKEIHFIIKVPYDHCYIWMDAEKIDIVIFNLLSNAFKNTPSGRSITIELLPDVSEECVILKVIDEGIGIPNEKASLIFTRFADIHHPKEFQNTGTGIGLSLSKELVDMHKGRIVFKSFENQGTTFTVELKKGKDHFDEKQVEFNSLPYKEALAIDHQSIFEPKSKLNYDLPHILLVEDDADLRLFLKNKFEGIYKVTEVENGMLASHLAEKIQPDLILTDLMMPEMDGIELTVKLRNNFPTSHIPIVLLTSRSSIESKLESLKYGADDYIIKPFDIHYLIARINNILELRKKIYTRFAEQVRILDIPTHSITVTDKDEAFLKNVIDIIHANIDNSSFQIESMVKETGLSRTNFFKKIKSLTGMAPVEFVNETRLKEAVALMELNCYSISEVAYKVGFNDAGYFTKCFKDRFGCTPSIYMEKQKINTKY